MSYLNTHKCGVDLKFQTQIYKYTGKVEDLTSVVAYWIGAATDVYVWLAALHTARLKEESSGGYMW